MDASSVRALFGENSSRVIITTILIVTAHLVQVAGQAVVEVLHGRLLVDGDARTIKARRQYAASGYSAFVPCEHAGRRGPGHATLAGSVQHAAAAAEAEAAADVAGAAGGEVAFAGLAQADAGSHGEVGWMRGGCVAVRWSLRGVRPTADERAFL